MKLFLFLLNIALLGGVLWSFSKWLPDKSGAEPMELTRRERKSTAANKKTQPGAQKAEKEYSLTEAAGVVAIKNIFDTARCPAASTAGRGGVSSGQLQLVGIFDAGGVKGAVITTKSNRRNNNNRFNPFRQNRNNQNSNASSKRSTANRGASSVNKFGEPAPEVRSAERGYYRIGDRLSNGYVLAAIERDHVILNRGSGKMELYLEDASVNQPAAPTPRRRTNSFQNLINVQTQQVQQQQQLMQMIGMMMRRNFQNNRTASGGGTVQISGGSRRTANTGNSARTSGSSSRR